MKIKTFKPNWKKFQNFHKYVEFMESKNAHRMGIVKVRNLFIDFVQTGSGMKFALGN